MYQYYYLSNFFNTVFKSSVNCTANQTLKNLVGDSYVSCEKLASIRKFWLTDTGL